MEYINRKKLPVLEMIFILLFSAYYILPSVESSINLIMMVLFSILYVLYCALSDKKTIQFVCVYLGCTVLLALLFTLLTDSQTISNTLSYSKLRQFLSVMSQYLFMYLPVIFSQRVINNASKGQQKMFFAIILVLYLIVTILTLRELAINPGIIRHWEEFSELEKQNIGNYYFVYAVPIIITTFVALSSGKTILQKTFLFALVIVFGYFILQAEYTLALLITLIGIIVVVYNSIKSFLVKVVFLLLALCVLMLLPNILNFIATNINSMSMSLRLSELSSFFSSGSAEGYNLNGRITLYKKAILAFFHSPIFGNRTLDFNGHALFLTVLSDTGILGGIPFFYLLFKSKKKIQDILSNNYKKYFPMFLCLVFIGLTNPIHKSYPVSFSVWFFAPLAVHLFFEEEYSK